MGSGGRGTVYIANAFGVKEAGIDTAKRFVDKVLTQGFG